MTTIVILQSRLLVLALFIETKLVIVVNLGVAPLFPYPSQWFICKDSQVSRSGKISCSSS